MIDTEVQNEPRRVRQKKSLAERAQALAGPDAHNVMKDEIDAMWGQRQRCPKLVCASRRVTDAHKIEYETIQ